MTLVLPEQKTPPNLSATAAKVLVHGHPGVGKSTLASSINPDRTLFLATEPGLGGLEVFQMPVGDWPTFLNVGNALWEDSKLGDKRRFDMVVIDTIDELAKFCTDHAMGQLGIAHPSDAAYGKGWDAVLMEWRLRIAKLASLGYGLWFIAHSVDREINTRVGTITKTVPTLSGKLRDWTVGFVDFVFYAEIVLGEDGERRELRTQPSENYEAKQRSPIKIPDPLALDGQTVSDALAVACLMPEPAVESA